jgi:hypothetical protein
MSSETSTPTYKIPHIEYLLMKYYTGGLNRGPVFNALFHAVKLERGEEWYERLNSEQSKEAFKGLKDEVQDVIISLFVQSANALNNDTEKCKDANGSGEHGYPHLDEYKVKCSSRWVDKEDKDTVYPPDYTLLTKDKLEEMLKSLQEKKNILEREMSTLKSKIEGDEAVLTEINEQINKPTKGIVEKAKKYTKILLQMLKKSKVIQKRKLKQQKKTIY